MSGDGAALLPELRVLKYVLLQTLQTRRQKGSRAWTYASTFGRR